MNVSAFERTLDDGTLPASRSGTARPTARGPAAVGEPAVTTTQITDLASLESAVATGLLRGWQRLADEAPHATIFQSPGWCLPWYRSYPRHRPFVIAVTAADRLVGVVPMEVDPISGALQFASNHVADYRDIIALSGYRKQVVEALIDAHVGGRFPAPLQVGWLDPESDTRALVEDVCAERRLHYVVSQQPCYRWAPPPPSKPSAQKFLNWYKRQGQVSFEIVESEEHWHAFRDAYFRDHSLRQLQAGRQRTFDEPARAAFYDRLFRSPDLQSHVTGFSVDGTLLAGHFGYVWRNVLYFGPPSIRLEHEQRSPAVILLSWIIQNASALGLKGFDLTVGDTDFKRRLSNHSVQATTIDIYPQTAAYLRYRARAAAIRGAKSVASRVLGPRAWQETVKPAAGRLAFKLARIREEGVVASAGAALGSLARLVAERRRGHVYGIRPAEVVCVSPRVEPGERLEFHTNAAEDLLLWHGDSVSSASAIAECARSFSRVVNGGGCLHTVVVNGRLAGWGYSYYPKQPAQLTETPGAMLHFEPGAVSMYAFHVLPEFRGRRLYQALLCEILRQRFAEGAPVAYISVLAKNAPSKAAIERVGFRLVAIHEYRRLLKWTSLREIR